MTLLTKKIKDLNEQDVTELEKPLGIKGRPFPTRKRVKESHNNGKTSLATRITLHQDDRKPFRIYSERPYDFVAGEAMRKMPTPSMLPYFFDGLKRRELDSKKRIQFIKGTAGAGKTFMSEFTAEMRDPRGPILIDCGQKNLAELLFETVLDFNQDKKFYQELDKRLANGQINPLSVQLLEENLGSALSKLDEGKYAINWAMIGRELSESGGEDTVPTSKQAVSQALRALKEVSHLEGLDNIGGNALGMATQEGPLIRAWKEGREIILDEFNRGKKGSTSSLHSLLNFLAGMGSNVTVENTLKEKGENEDTQTFTFNRADMRAGFFVTLTGNAEEDGDDVDELPQSVSSRIMPQTVPIADVLDWQHRICQIMTGLPLSTIYHSKPDQWDNDPDLFRKKLKEWRVMGLSEEEIADIPDLQMKFLDRWEDVLIATEKLAEFYHKWAELTNPDSALYDTGKYSNILMELSDTFFRETTIDFRKVVDHINEASRARSASILPEESEGYEEGPSNEPPVLEINREEYDPARYFGTNLTEIIQEMVYATSYDQGRAALYGQLESLMKDCGLKDSVLHEGKPNAQFTISALLDENPYSSSNPRLQNRLIRDMTCNLWRAKQGEDLPVSNEQLLDVAVVKKTLDDVKADLVRAEESALEDDAPITTPQDRHMLVLNDDANGFSFAPFKKARILDSASSIGFTAEQGGAPISDITAEQLVAHDDALTALIMPVLREHSLTQLWDKSLNLGGVVAEDLNGVKDESLSLAQGTSDSGLMVTTFNVAAQNNDMTSIHILFNKESGHSIIIGDGSKLDLHENFRACNIDYIDRRDKNAALHINNAVKALASTVGDHDVIEEQLCNAFLLRNTAPSVEDRDHYKLSDLILAEDSQNLLPQYVLKP